MSEISHWHIGYYDNGYCIEAIGFQNDNESWDVYYPTDEKDKDLLKFREWLENEYLPVLEQNKLNG
ncbi:DUF3986 family protein [Desulfosporosinus nitroreducens]|uniref:DUF3986 family protein n=1 Tax=Desulfosporosinus nitroreducens TaxID=2018668 RepID=UPI00207CA498|nr:DUF3986 family protein [Desulfosporosinus nitroreducens]MCO1604304.1 DUF3986 family protein [Desulfosporosinus nitroreducens]